MTDQLPKPIDLNNPRSWSPRQQAMYLAGLSSRPGLERDRAALEACSGTLDHLAGPVEAGVPTARPAEFFAGFTFALSQLAVLYPQLENDVELGAGLLKLVLEETDFVPEMSDLSRDALVALGADVYDAEQVMACLEDRAPEDV